MRTKLHRGHERGTPLREAARAVAAEVAVLLAVVGLLAGCTGGDSDPSGSVGAQSGSNSLPASEMLLFTDGDTKRSDLYVARVDGSDPKRLTGGAGFKYDADWAPDAKRIAYRYEPSAANPRSFIMVMDADGSDAFNLSKRSGVLGASPSWAPDGVRIAFAGSRDDPSDRPAGIYVVRADGSQPVRITPTRFEAQYPAWSPDGRRIAFAGVENGVFDLWIVNADGSGLRRLTSTPEPENWPMWSPNGDLLAVHTEPEGVVLMNADGSGRRPLELSGRDCGVPGSWAPGAWLVLNCALGGDRIGIGAIRADGTGFRLLIGGREGGFGALRP